MTELSKIDKKFKPITVNKINPKALSLNHLFGFINSLTNEWNHGIVNSLVNDIIDRNTDEINWIIFDGPADGKWVENLNTVLDDNKMLCLGNG